MGEMDGLPIQYRVACPYCKAKSGKACHVNRLNVCIQIHGVHRPRMRRALKEYPAHPRSDRERP